MKQKTEIVPFFPLRVFLLPGEDIPLRIFEPRYKQLIEDVRNNGITFVIPFVVDDEIQDFGSEVRLKEVVAENPGGRMVITVESVSVVRVISFNRQIEGKLYAGGAISRLSCEEPIRNQELISLIHAYAKEFDHDFLKSNDAGKLSKLEIIKSLNLHSDDKFKYVCIPGEVQKEEFLAGQLRYLTMIRKQESLLGNDFGLN
ncbi:MAG: LON peptidase substrate-binding domain-containing protein [Bacteroidales bacterium]